MMQVASRPGDGGLSEGSITDRVDAAEYPHLNTQVQFSREPFDDSSFGDWHHLQEKWQFGVGAPQSKLSGLRNNDRLERTRQDLLGTGSG